MSKRSYHQERKPENLVTPGFSPNVLLDMEYSLLPDTANQEFTRNPKNQIIQPPKGKSQELGEVVPPKKPPNTDAPSKSLRG